MEIINNRKEKIDAESKTKELEAMIQDLYDRLEVMEGGK